MILNESVAWRGPDRYARGTTISWEPPMDLASRIAQTIVPFTHNGQICFEPASGASTIGDSEVRNGGNGACLAQWQESCPSRWMREKLSLEISAPAKGRMVQRGPGLPHVGGARPRRD